MLELSVELLTIISWVESPWLCGGGGGGGGRVGGTFWGPESPETTATKHCFYVPRWFHTRRLFSMLQRLGIKSIMLTMPTVAYSGCHEGKFLVPYSDWCLTQKLLVIPYPKISFTFCLESSLCDLSGTYHAVPYLCSLSTMLNHSRDIADCKVSDCPVFHGLQIGSLHWIQDMFHSLVVCQTCNILGPSRSPQQFVWR